MEQSFKNVQYIIGSEKEIIQMRKTMAYSIFAPEIIDFLNSLAKAILKNTQAKEYPDVITFGFWCRKAAIEARRESYAHIKNRIGRGVIFHIAPSNVPVNCAYSMVAGLIAGNANIVRIPSKDYDQVKIIAKEINGLLDTEYQYMKPYIVFVKYGHSEEITEAFSMLCNTRVIWGGDNTIREIRKTKLPPRATEICFADRYSIAVIDGDAYLKSDVKDKIAKDFYNDTYLTDQNACTSPRLIMWLGKETGKAREIFWEELINLVKEKYNYQPVQAVSKLHMFYKMAANISNIHLVKQEDTVAMRIETDKLNKEIMDYRGNSGYFIEYTAKELNEIIPICGSECQTLSYFGIDKEEIKRVIDKYRPMGVDRIVPIGKTMDFALIWDGYDLIENMSRVVYVE